MIILAVIILLIILVISNFVLVFYNKVHPVCFNEKEYYNRISKLPDTALNGLSGVSSNPKIDYSKFRSVEMNKPKTWDSIYNSDNSSDNVNRTETSVGYVDNSGTIIEHPIFEEEDITNDDDDDDKSAYESVSAMFRGSSQKLSSNEKKNQGPMGLATQNEGLQASNKIKSSVGVRNAHHSSVRDGYH
jgi:hypothetical protein